jgi:hypothetical protein
MARDLYGIVAIEKIGGGGDRRCDVDDFAAPHDDH